MEEEGGGRQAHVTPGRTGGWASACSVRRICSVLRSKLLGLGFGSGLGFGFGLEYV